MIYGIQLNFEIFQLKFVKIAVICTIFKLIKLNTFNS